MRLLIYTLAGDSQLILDIVNVKDAAAIYRKRTEAQRVMTELEGYLLSYEGNPLSPQRFSVGGSHGLQPLIV